LEGTSVSLFFGEEQFDFFKRDVSVDLLYEPWISFLVLKFALALPRGLNYALALA
jgi:hypothetical protein